MTLSNYGYFCLGIKIGIVVMIFKSPCEIYIEVFTSEMTRCAKCQKLLQLSDGSMGINQTVISSFAYI